MPAKYLDLILMRELNVTPWQVDDLPVGVVLDTLACLRGERMAERERAEREKLASRPGGR